jgi:hypothetical protein
MSLTNAVHAFSSACCSWCAHEGVEHVVQCMLQLAVHTGTVHLASCIGKWCACINAVHAMWWMLKYMACLYSCSACCVVHDVCIDAVHDG